MSQKGRVVSASAAAALPKEIVTSLPEETAMQHALGRNTDEGSPALTPPSGDTGEDRIITDFGPGVQMRGRSSGGSSMPRNDDTSECFTCTERTAQKSCARFDPHMVLDCQVTDEQGLRRRVVYDPTEVARVLHPRSRRHRPRNKHSNHTTSPKTSNGASWIAAPNTGALLDRLAGMLETALDPSRPGRESLLICKAVTDAYLVNARRLVHPAVAAGGGGVPIDREDDFILDALRDSWRHAVEHWNGDTDEPHSAADLHVAASWFQAWSAADDMRGGGEPTMDMYKLHGMLPGNWAWVLDHLEIAGAPEG